MAAREGKEEGCITSVPGEAARGEERGPRALPEEGRSLRLEKRSGEGPAVREEWKRPGREAVIDGGSHARKEDRREFKSQEEG